jgi:hypothetical protein
MRRLSLSLKNKSPKEVVEICRKHKMALSGNPHFPALRATDAEFDRALEATKTALWEVAALKADLAAARTRLQEQVVKLKSQLTRRAGFIESQAAGDPVKLSSTGLGMRRDRTRVSALAAPADLSARATGVAGEIRVQWAAVERARVYTVEHRLQSEDPRQPWTAAALTTRTKMILTGLKSDHRHLIRVRAHGTRDIQSDWSAEISVMVL